MNPDPAHPREPTVFVVDDDASFLEGLALLLRAAGFRVKTFGSASEFLRQHSVADQGCVVADLRMPGLDGIELQRALARSENPLPFLFLTGHGDIPTTVTAMRHGAEDFLTKTAPRELLLPAVRRALERDQHERVRRAHQRDLRTRFAQLTPREREVLDHVLQGLLNKQIAGLLGVDERTVKRHRAKLMNKLAVSSVAQLAQLAQAAGITPEPPGVRGSE